MVSLKFFAQIGKTLLHYAARNGHRDCMKLLVHQYKCDPDKADAVHCCIHHLVVLCSYVSSPSCKVYT